MPRDVPLNQNASAARSGEDVAPAPEKPEKKLPDFPHPFRAAGGRRLRRGSKSKLEVWSSPQTGMSNKLKTKDGFKVGSRRE